MQEILFFVTATLCIVSALGVIFNKNVVHSALLLLINFCSLSVFYLMLNAQFLAIVQILVYAGAIVVLFLFVVMLLGADLGEDVSTWLTGWNAFLAALAIIMLTLVGTSVFESMTQGQSGNFTPDNITQYGQAQMIGITLFTDYILAVQLAAILLLVGIVGVIWLARSDSRDLILAGKALSNKTK